MPTQTQNGRFGHLCIFRTRMVFESQRTVIKILHYYSSNAITSLLCAIAVMIMPIPRVFLEPLKHWSYSLFQLRLYISSSQINDVAL